MRHAILSGKIIFTLLLVLLVLPTGSCDKKSSKNFIIDLTHTVPTFEPSAADPTKPDMSKPIGGSDPRGIPSFGPQTVLSIGAPFNTGQGYFYASRFTSSEHHGTHFDAPGHYRNNKETTESDNPDSRLAHELKPEEMVGPIVLIDVSARTKAELDKNGGQPSPDPSVTDFSNNSKAVVGPGDIDAVADQLKNGVWLVVNLGWYPFFHTADWSKSPYVNGLNFPGLNHAAIDRLIEIEDQKKIRIKGFVVDNFGVDNGEGSKGIDNKFTNAFYSHVRGLQRGWKMVENANNLGQLSLAKPGSCSLFAGPLKHVGGSGGPVRVIAECERK